jgi:hypothetical protein
MPPVVQVAELGGMVVMPVVPVARAGSASITTARNSRIPERLTHRSHVLTAAQRRTAEVNVLARKRQPPQTSLCLFFRRLFRIF